MVYFNYSNIVRFNVLAEIDGGEPRISKNDFRGAIKISPIKFYVCHVDGRDYIVGAFDNVNTCQGKFSLQVHWQVYQLGHDHL